MAAGALAATAAGLAACGGTAAVTRTAASGPTVPAAVRAQQEAIHRQVSAALHHHSASGVHYGGIPAYLPRPGHRGSRVVAATPRHHVLAIQGDTVSVHLPAGAARMTAAGPAVPDEVAGTDAARTPALFRLTLARVHGSVPVDARRFSVADDRGHFHRVTVSTTAGRTAPSHLSAGRPVTLLIRAVLPAGDGKLRYRPAGRELVAWDFIVETD